MKNLLNFTNRQDNIRKVGNKSAPPEIKIIVNEQSGITEYEPIINFDKDRDLPPDASIYIQAYSNEGYVGKPVAFGTVSKPETKIIKDSDVGKNEIKFRLKVVSNSEKSKKF